MSRSETRAHLCPVCGAVWPDRAEPGPCHYTHDDGTHPLTVPAAVVPLVEWEAAQKALEWYAGKEAWCNTDLDAENAKGGFFTYGIEDCLIAKDMGERARSALRAAKEGT